MQTWEEANKQFSDECQSHPGIECELELKCDRQGNCQHCVQAASDYDRHHLDGIRANVLRQLNDFAHDNNAAFNAEGFWPSWRHLSEKIADVIK